MGLRMTQSLNCGAIELDFSDGAGVGAAVEMDARGPSGDGVDE